MNPFEGLFKGKFDYLFATLDDYPEISSMSGLISFPFLIWLAT